METENWAKSQGIKERARQISWQDFSAMEEKEKIIFLNNSQTGNPFHVLFSQQFPRETLDLLCRLAEIIRGISKNNIDGVKFLSRLLSGYSALVLFVQESPRTRISFSKALRILGMTVDFVDELRTSSESNNERPEDIIRTFSRQADLIIMRHPDKQMVALAAWVLNKSSRRIPVINGGSGEDQHPTQALVDIYTLNRAFGGKIDGRTILFCGNLARGRTNRSVAYLMRNYPKTKLIFVSPPRLKMASDIKKFLKRHRITCSETTDLTAAIPSADVIYMTRAEDKLKDEEGPADVHLRTYQFDPGYQFKEEYLKLMKKDAILMHPGPIGDEIEERVKDSGDKRIAFWSQEENGIWIRVALMAVIFQKEREIFDYRPWSDFRSSGKEV